ncbi:MAG: phosphoribosylanthranilate isomerase [Anaerolineales bacterium]|nr:phosphoribosylanthranilate isomerase [Anaerolineales bacterium]
MTKIKICGIKELKDALAAIEAGADYLGFNFYPKSPRYIEKNTCAEITSVLKKEHLHIKLVGVFVNSSVDEVKDILQTCNLDFAQLHGDEPPEMLSAFNGQAFKAIRLSASNNPFNIRESASESAENRPFAFRESVSESVDKPAVLIDAQVKDVYGGSGVKADWEMASELAKRYKFFLAGGLTPENVTEAVRRVKAWGVDVASGVESTVGKKDAEKMVEFVRAVRSATSNQ